MLVKEFKVKYYSNKNNESQGQAVCSLPSVVG